VIILDTSVFIDHLRGIERAVEALDRATVSGERLAASVLTWTEILAGVRPREMPETRRAFDAVDWIGVDVAIAERAGLLANRYRAGYAGVDPVDYVIAATADLFDAELWTRNLKHFPMFPDLRPPY